MAIDLDEARQFIDNTDKAFRELELEKQSLNNVKKS
jgi:hypothetical protein